MYVYIYIYISYLCIYIHTCTHTKPYLTPEDLIDWAADPIIGSDYNKIYYMTIQLYTH